MSFVDKAFPASQDYSFNSCFLLATEIHQQSKPQISGLQVIQYLGTMLTGKIAQSLQLDDNLVITDDVRFVRLLLHFALIKQLQLLLGNERYPSSPELLFKTFLIDRFEKSAAQFAVNLEDCPLNGITFIPEE